MPHSRLTRTIFLSGIFTLLLIGVHAEWVRSEPCLPPPAGMVSWWPGDGNAKDIVDGHPGTLRGGATFGPGLMGQAFGFNGIDGLVTTNLILPATATIEFWVNPTSLSQPSSAQILLGTQGRANGNDRLWIVSSGPGGGPGVLPNTLVVNAGSCCTNDIVIANPLSVGTWTHLAVTFDYSADVYQLYVNGRVAANSTTSRTAPTQALSLGGATSDFGQNFFVQGTLDEVTVYARMLSATEVQAIFQAGSAGKCKVPALTLTLTGCTTCHPEDRFMVQAHLTNPGLSDTRVEAKIGVRQPDATPINLMGECLIVTLPAKLDATFTLFDTPVPFGLRAGT